MMTTGQMLITVLLMVVGTAATRFLPFLLFPEGRGTPDYVKRLGRTLPYAVIGMLVVYCLKEIDLSAYPFGAPELIAVAATAAIHFWKGRTLLSIAAGTAVYMILIQSAFVK